MSSTIDESDFACGPGKAFETPFTKTLLISITDATWFHPDDTEDEIQDRYHSAFISLASLGPRDPVEHMLAAQVIAAHYAAMECLRRAMNPDVNDAIGNRLRASAASMNRMMRETLRVLRQSLSQPLTPTSLDAEGRHPGQYGYGRPSPFADVPQPQQDPIRPEKAAPAARKDPMQSGDAVSTAVRPAAQRKDPMQSGETVAAKRPVHPLAEKVPNGDPIRDFMSRRFGPDESVEEAWEIAQRESAALQAARAEAEAQQDRHAG